MFVLTTYSATQETDQNNFNISKDVGTYSDSPNFSKKWKLKGFEPATFCFLTISFDLLNLFLLESSRSIKNILNWSLLASGKWLVASGRQKDPETVMATISCLGADPDFQATELGTSEQFEVVRK